MKIIFSHLILLIIGVLIGAYFFGGTPVASEPVTEAAGLASEAPTAAVQDEDETQVSSQSKSEVLANTHLGKNVEPQQKRIGHKYFKAPTATTKARKMMNEAALMDHFPSGGEPNDKLIQLFEDALELDPQNEMALSQYSNYLIMFDQPVQSKPLLKKCIKLYPKNELCHGNLATVFTMQGKWNESQKATAECLVKTPNSLMCLNHRANAFLRERQGKLALKDFIKMEALNGKNGFRFSEGLIYVGIAMSHEMLESQELALNYYKLACNQGQKYACKKIDQAW